MVRAVLFLPSAGERREEGERKMRTVLRCGATICTSERMVSSGTGSTDKTTMHSSCGNTLFSRDRIIALSGEGSSVTHSPVKRLPSMKVSRLTSRSSPKENL